jgi:two-component system CAI-1 autoinducer sensor kinase/phosphatase CqsS
VWLLFDRKVRDNSVFFIFLTYLVLIVALPFFFFYMFLQNNASGIWLGSLVAGIFYLALIVDPMKLILTVLSGVGGATLLFISQGNHLASMYDFYETVPVILFAVMGGIVFKYIEKRTIRVNQDKAVALAGSIAHELRTPLMGMQLELEAVDDFSKHSVDVREYEETLELLKHHHLKASLIVDCLLLNARDEEIDAAKFTVHSMRPIVEDVIRHYPLTDNQRQLITLDIAEDFKFWGEDFLMAHVLMNLIKNALTAIAAVEKGGIHICLSPGAKYNTLLFKDTGAGISTKNLNKIFTRFYSETNGGAGLGLAFCERVIRSFNGHIDCNSEPGQFTEFQIRLPSVTLSHT